MTGRGRDLDEREIEALAVAMIVAPGVYVRNRMFELLSSSGARRARTRAALVRGMVPQLAQATCVGVTREVRDAEPTFVLRYAVAALRLTRVVELSGAELAALRVVAARAGVRCLPVEPSDGERVAGALRALLAIERLGDAARRARDVGAPALE